MNDEQFKGIFKDYMKRKGFKCKKDNCYYWIDDTIIVVGLQKSQWGNDYYIRYGFSLRSLHKNNEYPKINECGICGGFNSEIMNNTVYPLEDLDEDMLLSSIDRNYNERVGIVISDGLMKYFSVYPQAISVARKSLKDVLNLS